MVCLLKNLKIVRVNPECSMDVDDNFRPKMCLPPVADTVVLADINRSTNELDTSLELFKKIALFTNMRLEIQKSSKKTKNTSYLDNTRAEEIMIVLGCALVMCYNKLPAMYMY